MFERFKRKSLIATVKEAAGQEGPEKESPAEKGPRPRRRAPFIGLS
jgi:hypothetical protein